MTFTIRFWDFDMDSAALGPVRCDHLDVGKKFAEYEARIRAGTVDSTELARNVFLTVAHRRTGDPAIDAKCGGASFTEEEVATIPLDELDLFCDKLVKGRLMLRATAADAEPPPAEPALPPGREALAPALLYAAEADRAAWKRTRETAERSMGSASYLAAQIRADQIDAVMGRGADARALQDMRRAEEIARGVMGTDDLIKFAMGQTSMNAVNQAMSGVWNSKQMIGDVLGADRLADSVLDPTAALKPSGGLSSAEEAHRLAMGPDFRYRPDVDVSDPKVFQGAPVPHLDLTPVRMPPMPVNPAHEIRATVGEMLAHQKKEAEKKDAARAEATTESGENKEIAKSGLVYTKANFWVAVIACIGCALSLAWGIWTYYSAKEDARQSEKKSAQIDELRAEIQALKARAPSPEMPATPRSAHKPIGQVGAKPK